MQNTNIRGALESVRPGLSEFQGSLLASHSVLHCFFFPCVFWHLFSKAGALVNTKENGAPQARHKENTKGKGGNGAPQARQKGKNARRRCATKGKCVLYSILLYLIVFLLYLS